jgi:hypothetical protein
LAKRNIWTRELAANDHYSDSTTTARLDFSALKKKNHATDKIKTRSPSAIFNKSKQPSLGTFTIIRKIS